MLDHYMLGAAGNKECNTCMNTSEELSFYLSIKKICWFLELGDGGNFLKSRLLVDTNLLKFQTFSPLSNRSKN